MNKESSNHTFVICAYKEVPYLEECVESLQNQTIKSEIIISTSTPNDYIKKVAKMYNVNLVINKGKSGHIQDFNFAYQQAQTKYVTLCHQDDVYLPKFAEKILKQMNKYKRPLIAFSNYNELKDGKIIKTNKVLKIKHLMNLPFQCPLFSGSKFIKKRVLSLGCPICAPTVTYNKELIKEPIIESEMKSNIDWITWIEFANMRGNFVYVKEKLLNHRIHALSTTSSVIANSQKNKEDYIIFKKFWPDWIAKMILKKYEQSELDYSINTKGNKDEEGSE